MNLYDLVQHVFLEHLLGINISEVSGPVLEKFMCNGVVAEEEELG